MESPATEENLATFLDELGIRFKTYRHAPVFTVGEAQAARAGAEDGMPGGHAKNLFVRDKKKHRALVVVEENRTIDLKSVAELIGLGRPSFGSADSLMEYLGVTPGSVTPFALYNARVAEGEEPPMLVALDAELLQHDPVNFHPLHNAATTAISPGDLIHFIRACGYEPLIVDFSKTGQG